jgi:hypothetical protein
MSVSCTRGQCIVSWQPVRKSRIPRHRRIDWRIVGLSPHGGQHDLRFFCYRPVYIRMNVVVHGYNYDLIVISFSLPQTHTVKMSTRKSLRVLKDLEVNGDPGEEKNAEVVVAGVKDTHGSEKATRVIITEAPPKPKAQMLLATVFAVHFKDRGTVVSTGSRDEANILLGQLPESVVMDCGITIKEFASSDDLDSFRASLKADNEAYVASKSRAIPTTATYDVKRANLKRSENPIALGLEDIPQVNVASANRAIMETSSSNDDQSADGVLASQSPAAKRMRSVIRTKGMKLIIHYWPGVPVSAIAQIVFIDIIDTRQDFTHWLQRPEKWVDVFGNIEQECENTPNPLGKFFTQMRSAHFRAPSGDNVSHTKIVKGSEGGARLTLHRQGLYTYLPHGISSDTIREHIKRNMARVLNDFDIQVCYRMIMTETSRNTKIPDLLNPRQGSGSGGVFWDQLQGAVEAMEFVPHASLKEVFLNKDVINITKSLFQDITDQMFTSGSLPAPVDAFANGVPL